MWRMWRLRVIEPGFDIWIALQYNNELAIILNKMDAIVYPTVDVIIFKSKEDMLAFRLMGGV